MGILAIILGLIERKSKLGKIAIVLGSFGILVTVVLYGSLFFFGFYERGGVFDELRAELVKTTLPDTINAIEAYKVRYGMYPESLFDLANITSPLNIYDQINFVGGQTYYYENHGSFYYVFSKGSDGEPFTEDDIFSDLTEYELQNLGYRLP